MKKSITLKVALTVSGCIVLGLIVMFIFLSRETQNREMERAEESIAETKRLFLESITFAMAQGAGDIKPLLKTFENSNDIFDLRLIPSNKIVKNSERDMDAVELTVLRIRQPFRETEKLKGEENVRIVEPILATSACQDCHEIEVGTPLATISMRYSLSDAHTSIAHQRNLFLWLSIGTLLLTLLLTLPLLHVQVIKEIKRLSFSIARIARGEIDGDYLTNRADEVGDAFRSVHQLQKGLAQKTEAANQISSGNLDVALELASETDSLGKAMLNMRNSLRASQDRIGSALEEANTKVGYLNGLKFPVYVVDTEMTVQYINPAAASIAGLKPEECIGKKCYELLKNPHCETDKCAISKSMRENRQITAETYLADTDIPLRYTGIPIHNNKGEVVGSIEQAMDLSDIKKVIGAVKETANRLREGDLASRVDGSNFEGDYLELVDGFNSAIDNLLRPMMEAQQCLAKMANGDLTVAMTGRYRGGHARLKESVNRTVQALNKLMAQIQVSVEQVASGAQQVASSSQAVSQGATKQASSLEEITSSMNAINSQSRHNAENSELVGKLAESSREAAQKGNEQMQQMLKAMEEINFSSHEISKIIKVIDEIAFQTNLLALNAAVEAAHAGAQGKGFAVVAEEVRNLAQRSAKAAKETAKLIEGSVERIAKGTKIADQTAISLNEIIDSITKVGDLIGEISSSSAEQVVGMEAINKSFSEIDQVTQTNAASAEESAAAAEELSGQSRHLSKLLDQFTLTFSSTKLLSPSTRLATAVERSPVVSTPIRENGQGKTEGNFNQDEIINLDDSDFGEF